RVVRGYLGLHGRSVPIARHLARRFSLTQTTGVEVMAVGTNGPAGDAGVEEGGILTGPGGPPPARVGDPPQRLMELPVGIAATVTLLREERRLERLVVPGDYPYPASP